MMASDAHSAFVFRLSSTTPQLLGIASRGIDFGGLGGLGVLNIVIKAGNELFRRLLQRADRVSTAMVARGVSDMRGHKVLVDERDAGGMDARAVATNVAALGVLAGSVVVVMGWPPVKFL